MKNKNEIKYIKCRTELTWWSILRQRRLYLGVWRWKCIHTRKIAGQQWCRSFLSLNDPGKPTWLLLQSQSCHDVDVECRWTDSLGALNGVQRHYQSPGAISQWSQQWPIFCQIKTDKNSKIADNLLPKDRTFHVAKESWEWFLSPVGLGTDDVELSVAVGAGARRFDLGSRSLFLNQTFRTGRWSRKSSRYKGTAAHECNYGLWPYQPTSDVFELHGER